MNTEELYSHFEIMPQLRTHMLRVAGVAKIISENWSSKVEVERTVNICLVHDLGNIVKFDLSGERNNKMFGEIENIDHWRQVQQKYIAKFGTNAHVATIGMLKECGLVKYVEPINVEEKLYFAEATAKDLEKTDLGAIILMYADCKVVPQGVVTYRERINDLIKRYGGGRTASWQDWTHWFEDWMQKNSKVRLNEITEREVEPLFSELLTREL